MTYTHYPFTNGNETNVTVTESVKTYKLEIKKTDAENTNKFLTGAKFDVYLVVDDSVADIDPKYTTNGNGVAGLPSGKSYLKVGEMTESQGGTGLYSIERLDAGEYYLVETVVPGGYTAPADAFGPFIVNDTNDNSDNDDNKSVHVIGDYDTVKNSEGFLLPETGGTGTVIFTVVGVSLMCVAVLAFFILRKKEMSKN